MDIDDEAPHNIIPPRVSFVEEIEMKILKNLADKHKSDLWYTSIEIKRFKYQTAMVIQSIASMNMTVAQYAALSISETSSFMGLENYLTSQAISFRRKAIRSAVFSNRNGR